MAHSVHENVEKVGKELNEFAYFRAGRDISDWSCSRTKTIIIFGSSTKAMILDCKAAKIVHAKTAVVYKAGAAIMPVLRA